MTRMDLLRYKSRGDREESGRHQDEASALAAVGMLGDDAEAHVWELERLIMMEAIDFVTMCHTGVQ